MEKHVTVSTLDTYGITYNINDALHLLYFNIKTVWNSITRYICVCCMLCDNNNEFKLEYPTECLCYTLHELNCVQLET